jgi:hypothetical protein
VELITEKPNKRGRPPGAKNKEKLVERVPSSRFAELMDGSSPRTAGERIWKRRFERMPPQEQVRRRLDLEPKQRAEDAPSSTFTLIIEGLSKPTPFPTPCKKCGYLDVPAPAEKLDPPAAVDTAHRDAPPLPDGETSEEFFDCGGQFGPEEE